MTTQLIGTILLIGLLAGTLSGLVGIGGGIVLVPALVYFLNFNQHQAQGTSLGVLVFPVVILGFLFYYFNGQKTGEPIDFKVIGLLAAGFVIGGLLGSNIAIRIDVKSLKKIFAILLFYTGIKMMGWDSMLIKWIRGFFA
jgi:uncharacterized protein